MEYSPSYQVNVKNREVIVRFQRGMIDETSLGLFLDYLEMESIRRHSKLTEKQASQLAKEIDKAVWANLKKAFLEA